MVAAAPLPRRGHERFHTAASARTRATLPYSTAWTTGSWCSTLRPCAAFAARGHHLLQPRERLYARQPCAHRRHPRFRRVSTAVGGRARDLHNPGQFEITDSRSLEEMAAALAGVAIRPCSKTGKTPWPCNTKSILLPHGSLAHTGLPCGQQRFSQPHYGCRHAQCASYRACPLPQVQNRSKHCTLPAWA